MRRRQLAALFLLCLSGVALTGCKRDDSSDLDKGMALVKKGNMSNRSGALKRPSRRERTSSLPTGARDLPIWAWRTMRAPLRPLTRR